MVTDGGSCSDRGDSDDGNGNAIINFTSTGADVGCVKINVTSCQTLDSGEVTIIISYYTWWG